MSRIQLTRLFTCEAGAGGRLTLGDRHVRFTWSVQS